MREDRERVLVVLKAMRMIHRSDAGTERKCRRVEDMSKRSGRGEHEDILSESEQVYGRKGESGEVVGSSLPPAGASRGGRRGEAATAATAIAATTTILAG